LIGVALVAVLVAVYRQLHPFLAQQRTLELVEELGGSYQTVASESWERWLFGKTSQNIVLVDLGDCDEPHAYLRQIAALPRVETLAVGGPTFGDAELRQLRRLAPLRSLVLDTTAVSAEALTAWQDQRPEVYVYSSQRRALRTLRGDGWGVHTRRSAAPADLCTSLRAEYFEEAFDVSGQPTDEMIRELPPMPSVERLTLDGRRLKDDACAYLRQFPRLTKLSLYSPNIVNEDLAHIGKLANLQELNFLGDSRRLTNDGMIHLRALNNLKELYFSRTGVNSGGVTHLRGLPKLETVSFHDMVFMMQAAPE
jgi:hypothetical protein